MKARVVPNQLLQTSAAPPKSRIRLPLEVIRAVDEVYSRFPPIKCQGKCQACCSPVGNLMTAFERDRIIARTGKAPNDFTRAVVESVGCGVIDLDSAPNLRCNMLTADGRCSVYDIRPAICRLWGTVPGMPCKEGCEGAVSITEEQGAKLMLEVIRISNRQYE